MENYQPWFEKINPLLEVPVIKFNDDSIIYDSFEIIKELEKRYPEISLYLDYSDVKLWVDKIKELPIHIITFGNMGWLSKYNIPSLQFSTKISRLQELSLVNSTNSDIYKNKLINMRQFISKINDKNTISEINNKVYSLLDEIEIHLSSHIWMVNDRYTLADTYLFNLLYRLEEVGLFDKSYPNLHKYFKRNQERKSFDAIRLYNMSFNYFASALKVKISHNLGRLFNKIIF
jgi:glutathione S-transferase